MADQQEQNNSTTNNKEEALKEKNLGNGFYKIRKFDEALEHYNKAIEFDRTDMTLLNNKAAVYFEKGDYDESVKQCNLAIDVGRENRADFKLIAKAMSRMASAYVKKDDLDQAKTFFQKSLSEHRTPDTLSKLSEVEKILREREQKAYIDVGKSIEEKTKGNEYFQRGDYPTAIKHYTEAIRRNPDDAKIFSNRAACYQKLAEFKMACDDADECIKRDPKFIKGYIRKGMALLAMKKFVDAVDVFQAALELDNDNTEAKEGYMKAMNSADPKELRSKAVNNPEIQEIFSDPAMQMILQQGQTDPTSLREHLKNPDVAKKFQKLMEAGIIHIR